MKAQKTPLPGNLKTAEIRPLIFAAKKAFDIQVNHGLADPETSFEKWRHDQCLEAVGKPGLKACHHADFQPLMFHFKTLSGDMAGAFESAMKSGAPLDHSDPGDTRENRRVFAHHIAQAIRGHLAAGGTIGVGYLVAIVRGKTRRPDLTLGTDWEAGLADRCTCSQLDQIRSTIINRIAAANGSGCISTRNKSQRTRTVQKTEDFSGPDRGQI